MLPSSLAGPQGEDSTSSARPPGRDTERYMFHVLPPISRAHDTSFVSPSKTYAPSPVPNATVTVPSSLEVMLTIAPKLSQTPLNVP